MKIVNYSFARNNVLDYINKDEKIMQFYPLHFKDRASWQSIMDKVKSRTYNVEVLADILKKQNIDFGADKNVIETIEQLLEKDTYAVVTGQQVGIFTGPLYTIYKAATAIKLCLHLSQEFRAKFIPIFWIESNDHDIQEVNHIYLVDSQSNLVKFEYMPPGYVPYSSMKNTIVGENFSDFIHEFYLYFHDTEFKAEIFKIIKESYLPSRSLSYGFASMMCRLFSRHGLVILDPSDSQIKKLMMPIFTNEIENPLKSTRSINAIGERLKAQGYDSQIEKSEDSTCLFIEKDGLRHKLLYRDDHFEMDGEKKVIFTKEQLLQILQTQPWKFSPNVALRPITQDYILPTTAYVAGPGEISYFAQLSELYQYNGIDMPIIYPRSSFIIIESKIQKIIDTYNLDIVDLSLDYEKLFSKLSKQRASKDIEEIVESSKSEVEKVFDKLTEKLSILSPDLKNICQSVRKKVDQQFFILKQKAYQAQRDRDEIMRNQIKRACINIFPDGKPQERVFNVVQYLVLYGLQFIENVISAIELS